MKKAFILTGTILSTLIAGQSAFASSHTVEKGDSLWKISKTYNSTVQDIKDTNNLTSNIIIPGQVLKINDKENTYKENSYVVKAGDSLSKIAKANNTSTQSILKLNPEITNPDRIFVGQAIRISGQAPATSSTKPTPSQPAPAATEKQSTTPSVSNESKADAILSAGEKYLGAKYVYGASTSRTDAFDCSSFTLRAFKEGANISLPRTSLSQANIGKPVSLSNLQKGDLVFFDTNKDGVINHVGIYAGNGKMLNASTSKGVSYANIDQYYWEPRMVSAVRVL